MCSTCGEQRLDVQAQKHDAINGAQQQDPCCSRVARVGKKEDRVKA
jgi:hypothetical protein